MMKFSEITYERPNLEAITQDIKQRIGLLNDANDFETQKTHFVAINQYFKKIMGAQVFASVKFSLNIADTFFESENDFFDQESPSISQLNKEFKETILKSPFRKEFETEFGKQFFDLAELEHKIISNEVIEDLQKENQLSSAYQKLIASIQIEFDGFSYNISGMSPLMEHTDRAYRKRAAKALYSQLMTHREELDKIYDELVTLRDTIAKKQGYKNFVAMGYDRMGRTCYGADEISKYRELIEKYVTPRVHQYKDKVCKMLDLDVLYQYDTLIFSDGNATPKESPEQMIQDAQIMYKEMSKETGEFFDQMIELETMDLLNRENKSPGGYCTYIPQINFPYIFSNFNGTSHDVDVLTHEAGHAFQCYCSRDFLIDEYLFPTSEAAEIHSMSMEFFAGQWVHKFFKEDTDKYLLSHLLKSLFFLPYGVTVDEFQQKVYEQPTMTPADRRNLWNQVSRKYSPWIAIDQEPFLEEGSRWQIQSHIYQSPFYYIDYTLAQLCAFQFYKKMHDNFEVAWEDYYRLCCQGGSKNFLELVSIANLDSPFEETSFKETIDFVCEELDKLFDQYESSKNN